MSWGLGVLILSNTACQVSRGRSSPCRRSELRCGRVVIDSASADSETAEFHLHTIMPQGISTNVSWNIAGKPCLYIYCQHPVTRVDVVKLE